MWFLLFVILGFGLPTAFIAGGVVLAACLLAAGMVSTARGREVLDAPLTAPGLLLGIAAFITLEVVLSVPTWISVIAGLGIVGVYGITAAAVRSQWAAAQPDVDAVRGRAPASGMRMSPSGNGQGGDPDPRRREPALTH